MEKYYYNKNNDIQLFNQNNRGNNNNRGRRIRGSYNDKGRGNYQELLKDYNNNKNIFQYYPINNQKYFNYYNPYIQKDELYRIEKYIMTNYNNLIDINNKNSNILSEINTDCKFYIIKSFSEEDIHKSIKYGVWSSSKNGNLTLSNSFKLTKEKNGNVYLFFSCNGSGRYAGIARMKSPVDENRTFDFWTQDGKWPGLFDVEWIFIKDVPFKEFKEIIITMKDGETKPISNARDTQEIPFEQAKIMFEIISKFQNRNTILEHFEFYDLRQENYEKNMQMKKNYDSQQYNNSNININNNVDSKKDEKTDTK